MTAYRRAVEKEEEAYQAEFARLLSELSMIE